MDDVRAPVMAWFGLGANLGDRVSNLAHALRLLGAACQGIQASSVFETPPWGDLDQPAFLNLVARGSTCLDPDALLDRVKGIEREVGRRPTRRWGPRVVDIDILAYGDLVNDSPRLVIPHPRMTERAFVMVPLADLDPGWLHPAVGRTAAAIAAEFPPTVRSTIVRVGPAPMPDARTTP